tara:strand:+ start:3911 stop:4249 length:339 start_codon:yes stop_codon:yes gene_type:complete
MCIDKERRKKLTINTNITPELHIPTAPNIPTTPDTRDKLYIYFDNDRMPKGGWMQSCFSCSIFTARTLIFREEVDRSYIVYICNHCKRTLINKDKNIKFKKKCIKFINKYFN